MSRRYFTNPYPSYEACDFEIIIQKENGFVISPEFSSKVDQFNVEIIKKVLQEYKNYTGKDFTVYTGLSGIFYLLLKLKGDSSLRQYLISDEEIETHFLQPCLNWIKGGDNEITFQCGKVGPLTLTALFFHMKMDVKQRDIYCREIASICKDIESKPDELLYGKSGYLYSLLLLRNTFRIFTFDEAIKTVSSSIISSGKRYSVSKKSACPLMYQWYNTEYIGAAHGISGILYMLLLAREFLKPEDLELVKSSIDYLLGIQFKDGNFPAVHFEGNAELVHWCHGAPGVIYLMLKAYQVYREEKYLNSARKAAEVIWIKGLLKKGNGLCHGTAGNGYAFLAMYRATSDPKYLYQATRFAEWCFDFERPDSLIPDNPFSLMEGMAGTSYFLSDLKNPLIAKFPGFCL